MSIPTRLLDTGLKPARWNIAMTAALAELHSAGRIPDTLRFHRYPRSVLLGRHQILANEIRLDRCGRDNIEIARRVTGGGAVYMSPGILAWDMVIERRHVGFRPEDASASICTAIADGLSRLGLPARYRAPSDVVIANLKVSGSSGIFLGPTLVCQGTVLLDFDIAEMTNVLKVLTNGSRAPGIASVADFLGRVPADDEITAVLTASLSHGLSRLIEAAELGDEELNLAERLLDDEIGTDAFVHGAPVRPEIARKTVSTARGAM